MSCTEAKKNWIEFKINLELDVLKKYLRRLTDADLLRHKGIHFVTTRKGILFLEQYKNLVKHISAAICEADSFSRLNKAPKTVDFDEGLVKFDDGNPIQYLLDLEQIIET